MDLISKLKGDDLRSIGRADEVVGQIGDDQKRFDQVFQGIFDSDPVIRMRAADVIEKVSRNFPHLLKSHKREIVKNLSRFEQQEVKWHMALMIPSLKLTSAEKEKIYSYLADWAINDKSRIVRVNAMQALADISLDNKDLRKKTVALVKDQIESGIPSLASRGRKLLQKLEGD